MCVCGSSVWKILSTVGSRFTKVLHSRIFGSISNRRKTVLFKWFKVTNVHGPNKLVK